MSIDTRCVATSRRPLDSSRVLRDLEPTIERLLSRHLRSARDWFPHEYVPWERARDVDPTRAWRPDDSSIGPAASAALFVNLLTEDNLPYYFGVLSGLGGGEWWGEWARRWTAEEGRHSVVIRDYMTVTRVVDACALERARMQQVSSGWSRAPIGVCDVLVYAALQELATRVAHRNTGRLLDDEAGAEIMSRVAADENLHHLFYRDLVSAAIEVAPSQVVTAIDRTLRDFAMPGAALTNFPAYARAMAAAGVYDYAIHHDQIVRPVVLHHWNFERIEGLDREARAAHDRVMQHIERLARVAGRIGRRPQAHAETRRRAADDAAATVLAGLGS